MMLSFLPTAVLLWLKKATRLDLNGYANYGDDDDDDDCEVVEMFTIFGGQGTSRRSTSLYAA